MDSRSVCLLTWGLFHPDLPFMKSTSDQKAASGSRNYFYFILFDYVLSFNSKICYKHCEQKVWSKDVRKLNQIFFCQGHSWQHQTDKLNILYAKVHPNLKQANFINFIFYGACINSKTKRVTEWSKSFSKGKILLCTHFYREIKKNVKTE